MHIIGHGHHDHHEHTHDEHQKEVTPAALLEHMVAHNRSHADELEKLAATMDSAVQEDMTLAVSQLRAGNDTLAKVLAQLKGE